MFSNGFNFGFMIPSDDNAESIYNFIDTCTYKFVSNMRQVGGFPLCPPVSSTNNTDRHDITEILLKVALNTITLTTL